MDTTTEPSVIASRYGSLRWRSVGYWLATVLVAAELGLGGIWDIERLPMVRDLVTHLGYPSYFLVLLGTWKVLGAVALLVPRRPLLKEWAYAGAFFHLHRGDRLPPDHRLRPRRAAAADRADRPDRAVVGAATPQPPYLTRRTSTAPRPLRSQTRSLVHFTRT
jgi:hypothetical protein